MKADVSIFDDHATVALGWLEGERDKADKLAPALRKLLNDFGIANVRGLDNFTGPAPVANLADVPLSRLMDEIRGRGFPVCVFQPEDVASRVTDHLTPAQRERAAVELLDNLKWVEDAMSTAGNEAIENLIDPAIILKPRRAK
jgi:hypothetical protein